MNPQSFDYRYSGGSLNADDPTYVMRQADWDFYNGLKDGEFCYVLNSRQMGKSSLRVRTMARLQAEGIVCAFIDLTGIGKESITPEQWYADIVRSLVNSCLTRFNWRKWWREQRDFLSPVQRLKVFIEEILLVKIKQKIVIFVDEIDRVLSQKFSLDDFFAIIRTCYNLRSNKPKYKRLTWALLGVATPFDLITNPHSNPFNIGNAIALQGFQLTESLILAEGLKHLTDTPEELLKAILYWTGGQPFLTQKLCWLVAKSNTIINQGKESDFVTELVQNNVIKNWESQDEPPHLKTIRSRIIYSPQSSKKLLLLYQQILRSGKIAIKKAPEYRELQLSGLVTKQGKYLKVYNPIYREVFNNSWVKKELATLEEAKRLSLGLVFTSSILITILVTVMRSLLLFQSWELAAYDLLMRTRPTETEDNRLLIIGATEQDLNNYGYPLPDRIIAKLLNKIQEYNPSAIGLDIVRDHPVPKEYLVGHKALNYHFKNNPKLIPVCAFDTNIAPPSASPSLQLGFVDLYDDREFNRQDDTIRRYLLSRSNHSSEICPSPYSFAWQLIYLYLDDKEIEINTIDNNWKFGSLITRRLEKRSGGYQNLDARGNQILINYRNSPSPQKIAQQIGLGDILNKKIAPTLIEDRVILIAVTASSVQDSHDTPYGEMRGVNIHAHVISQILSAVENNRPLIKWFTLWQDMVFIWVWSFIGGLVIWYFSTVFSRSIAIGILVVILHTFCWIMFTQGFWLPLIPTLTSLVTMAASLAILKQKKDINFL
ncbi:MAG: CHASE2 domain-containing protein [Xenococcaceae cyanobacterium MO_167.B52]|nr:CHASE2 domain-containing protein [Xenococcaceae cyanobacterium MO_167.B52]